MNEIRNKQNIKPCDLRSGQLFEHVLDTILRGLQLMKRSADEQSNRSAYTSVVPVLIRWWFAAGLNYRLVAIRKPVLAQCALWNNFNELIELVRWARYMHSNDLHAVLLPSDRAVRSGSLVTQALAFAVD